MVFENDRGVCPNCELATAFTKRRNERLWPFYRKPGSQYDSHPPASTESIAFLTVLECTHCEKSVTYVTEAGPEDAEGVRPLAQRVVYPSPSPRDLDATVPPTIRGLFREASGCEGIGAMRAAGVMYRATVEEIVKDLGAQGKDLHKKIGDLVNKGAPQSLVDDLHEARMLGNDSIHAGIEFAPEEVGDVGDLVAEACLVLYEQPAQRLSMRQARQARRDASRKPKQSGSGD